MNEIEQLHIFRTVIPATRLAIQLVEGEEAKDCLEGLMDSLVHSVIYDCTRLPRGFIEDTGQAYFDELLATKGQLELPEGCCWFEFPDDCYGCLWRANDAQWLYRHEDGRKELDHFPHRCDPVLYYG